jgi:hypothetical protein
MTRSTIPAFLSIDVEPDAFQLSRSSPPDWSGFHAVCGFTEQLRADLRSRTGESPRFGWYFRTDPQIAEVCGRATYALEEFSEHIARLAAQGDYFGVHIHPVRWSESHGLWVHDFADREWLRSATRFSLKAYQECAGVPARRVRMGASFINNEIVTTLEEMGVAVDLTLEPVAGWGLSARAVPSGVDESPIVGAFLNCREAPREAYRPSRCDFQVPDRREGRRLAIIPLTTYGLPEKTTLRQRLGRAFTGKPRRPAQVLYPGLEWPSPTHFWDLAAREVCKMRRPQLSLAIRTDAAGSKILSDVLALFDALPRHPLSKSLHFVDPLEAVTALVA